MLVGIESDVLSKTVQWEKFKFADQDRALSWQKKPWRKAGFPGLWTYREGYVPAATRALVWLLDLSSL